MKIIQTTLAIWAGIILFCMTVLIPSKEGSVNTIFGWGIYILETFVLIFWVVDEIKKPVDEDFKIIALILAPAFIVVTSIFLIYFFIPGDPFSNVKNIVNSIFK
ncbi:hypothetical protein [Leuconostoc suionicum]|uniref:hypothetical protein n=1 Tax=Leuconostoc suionicum TaxID=1511761 RepID=UPI0039E8133F